MQASVQHSARRAAARRDHRCRRPALASLPAGLAALAAALLLLVLAGAAGAATVSSAPDRAVWSANGQVYAIATAADGTTYIGGQFTQMWPATGGGALVDADGDPVGVPLGINGYVMAAAPDGQGGYYLGGEFTSIGGQAHTRLAHLLADGTVDDGWSADVTGSSVYAIAVSGDTVFVGGLFTKVDGVDRANLAALDAATGDVVAGWAPVPDSAVYTLAVSGTTVYAGGGFRHVSGTDRDYIALLDAATGGLVAGTAAGADNTVYELAVSPSGDTVYAAGAFSSIGGLTRQNIAALDPATGAAVAAWNASVGTGGSVFAVSASGDTVYFGGAFGKVDGVTRKNLAAVDAATGALKTGWDPAPDIGISGVSVYEGAVYVAGYFSAIGGATRSKFAALDATTGLATDWVVDGPPGTQGWGVSHSGSTFFAGGLMSSIGIESRSGIAALDAGGALTDWQSGALAAPVGVTPRVDALAIADGTLYAGGVFTSVGGTSRSSLAAFDAATGALDADWVPDATGGSPPTDVRCLAVSGDTVYAGGEFTSIGATPVARDRVAALDAASGDPTAWDPDADGTVNCLQIAGDTIYAGGSFATIGGEARNRIAALDVSQDSTGTATAWDPNANGAVNSLLVSGSTVYAGGAFTAFGATPVTRNHLAALDAGTGAPTTWDPDANGSVNGLGLYLGNIYAGGAFTTVGGTSRLRLAAVDASTGILTDWNPAIWLMPVSAPPAGGPGRTPQATPTVNALAVANERVYTGGLFDRVGLPAQTLVRPYFTAFLTQYTVTPGVSGGHGAISPAVPQVVYAGETPTFTFAPDVNYAVDTVLVGGSPVTPTTPTTYTLPAVHADTDVTVSYKLVCFTIVASAGAHGTISPSGTRYVIPGASQTFVFRPAEGYHVAGVLVDGRPAVHRWHESYTFTDVAADHTIAVSFAPNEYLLSAVAGPGGTTSPAHGVLVLYGGSQTFAITPDRDYRISDVTVDGVSVGAVGSYTFTAVAASHLLEASFARSAYVVRASAGEGGSLSPAGEARYAPGEAPTYAITPEPGHHLERLLLDGAVVAPTGPDSYTFAPLAADHTLRARFAADGAPLLGRPKAPARVAPRTFFTVRGARTPGAPPVTIGAWRREAGVWRFVRSLEASGEGGRYAARFRFARPGRYRFRAASPAAEGWLAAESGFSDAVRVR